MKRTLTLTFSGLTVLAALLWATGLAGAGPLPRPNLQAGAPTVVSYQGQVKVNGSAYGGTGYFKFAVLDGTSAGRGLHLLAGGGGHQRRGHAVRPGIGHAAAAGAAYHLPAAGEPIIAAGRRPGHRVGRALTVIHPHHIAKEVPNEDHCGC
jgi:hypothetical protein